MLTKESKKLLKSIRLLEPDLQGRFYTVDFVAAKSKLGYAATARLLNLLALEGYISYADKQKSCFLLEEKGLKYNELRGAEARKRWAERIWIFACGVATGVITAKIIEALTR